MKEPDEVSRLRSQAARCRRLARELPDVFGKAALLKLAGDFDQRAEEIRLGSRAARSGKPPPPSG